MSTNASFATEVERKGYLRGFLLHFPLVQGLPRVYDQYVARSLADDAAVAGST
jgi:hypothetical protein